MKVVFTKHSDKKFIDFEKVGLIFFKEDVLVTVKNPDHIDEESDAPKLIASKRITEKLVLRVVFKIEGDIMTIITFYLAKRGRYYED